MAGKKKLTKKEKQRLEYERAEALRIEQEKERQRQLEEEREQKRLERADAERRQKQQVEENKIRRVQLKESCDYFSNLQSDVDKIYDEFRKKREWKIYMRCNGLPNTYDPGDIRKYIHMWLLDNKRANEAERNWLLYTNETSILTQDHRVVNMTRSHLKEQQHNLGDTYAKRVTEVLGILNEMNEAIFDTDHLSNAIRDDLNNLKYIFRTTLSQYIDEYSHKILSNIDRDMDVDGLSLARHKYESKVFKTQLWTLREAPMPPLNPKEQAKLDRSHTEIQFPLLEMDITLPPSVKMMNTAVRVLWLNYDHFSDYCPSYTVPNQCNRNFDEDISKAARKEWQKRKELIQQARLENELIHKNGKNSTESLNVVDADKLYENYEKEQAELNLINKGPKALGLKEFDINMRRYRIVAGIYYVEHLEQPQQDTQLEAKKFLRTLSNPYLRRIGYHQTYKPPPPVLPGVRRLPEEIEAEMREVEANLDRLGSVNIKLPEDIIWFEPPIVCRWESVEESMAYETPESVVENVDNDEQPRAIIDSADDRFIMEDFNLLDVPAGLDLYTILREFVVPRMPDGYIVKMGELEVKSRKSSTEMPKLKLVEPDLHPCIKDSLELTNSPRPLFPSVEIRQELQILEKRVQDLDDEDEDEVSDPDRSKKRNSKREYMFSQLLRDLDEICEQQVPYPDTLMDEITEHFEEEEEQEEEQEPEQDYMGISFMRANEYSWSLNQKEEETLNTNQQTEDFDSDSELEDEEEEKLSNEPADLIPVGKWTSRDVHDVKFNEEKLSIQFKFGRLGAYGLAINWYNNLPFQGWELKPDIKDPDIVIFNLTGAIISIEVSVLSEGFILNSYQGGLTAIVQDIIGVTMSFYKLKETLFQAAINLFPEEDAFCYTEGTCEKNGALESHVYTCMASLALTHNFGWSRWNMLSGRRSCVLLMREVLENRKLPPYSTLLVTPQKATLIDCTDVSSSFNPIPIEGMNFNADLHHLAQDQSTPASLEKQEAMDSLLRQNIITLLKATRPLSFC